MMSQPLKTFLLCSSLAFALPSTAEVHLIFKASNNPEDKKAKDLALAPSEHVLNFVNAELDLHGDLDIIYGAEDGPLFDPKTMSIQIPYEFVHEVYRRFTTDKYHEQGIDEAQATGDAIMHTLLHEYGHAYVFANEVPVLGKEEDAVDNLATILLLNFFENGDEIAYSAADLFALEDQDTSEYTESHFWDEHSLDAQRYFSTLCLIYGSDPEKYATMFEQEQIDEERDRFCIEEFEHQTQAWFEALQLSEYAEDKAKSTQ
ncbi:DUF4344 domain-containing metallopeptidase [Vibrio sp. Of7-15]|uniref:DUF4344 domain-containing metallopeptidase n=1 Tax=Vibrio sp. Of7-15 TaxID=2724879 RepID=UPI001EF1890C|nr:DUF4344 domain-containing metallopeptidase [Vibrio sp. Of7-15]MCG7497945.1 DUF4344 domain-containing metallopeptidase [Vibrio sp. Of7-15]